MSVQLRCKVHKVPLVCFCPACRGSVTSQRKAEAARRNGRLGGRPRGSGKRQGRREGKR